jgi:exportin-1
MAQEVLTTLKEHPDAWTRVDTILEFSSDPQTKYYALQILENVIKTRWKILPKEQREGMCFTSFFVEIHIFAFKLK